MPHTTAHIDLFPSTKTPFEQVMEKRLAEIEAMIQLILGVLTPLKKSLPHSYAKSPVIDAIALMEKPKKFIFPNIKLYDDISDPNDHIAS